MLVGFKCPRSAPTAGQCNPFDYCVNECPHRCMPPAFLHVIAKTNVHNEHRGDMISPSALKGCSRKLIWERMRGYYYEPTKLYGSVRGSLIHGFIEEPWGEDVYTERRFYYTMTTGAQAPYVLSGRLDGYYVRNSRTLYDLKTMHEGGTFVLYNTGAKPEHIMQTNVYRFLAKYGHLDTPDGPVMGWDTDNIVIDYAFMNRVISTGRKFTELFYDFKEPNYGRPYKLEVKREQIGKTKRGCPIWEVIFDIPAVPIMSDEEVLRHIEETAPEKVRGFREYPTYVPPGVMNTPDSWLCDWCGVREMCEQYEEEQRRAAAEESLPFEEEQ